MCSISYVFNHKSRCRTCPVRLSRCSVVLNRLGKCRKCLMRELSPRRSHDEREQFPLGCTPADSQRNPVHELLSVWAHRDLHSHQPQETVEAASPSSSLSTCLKPSSCATSTAVLRPDTRTFERETGVNVNVNVVIHVLE